jgi:Ran GTPase-activating protein (RanGAP) involved in mRNA processing and transport
MTAISSLLEKKHLLNLSLHNQHIEDGEVLDISPLVHSMLDSNSFLKFLDLSRNSLRDDDIVDLMDALVENRFLEILHLDQNLITDRGAKMIAERLPKGFQPFGN